MLFASVFTIVNLLLLIAVSGGLLYLFFLLIKALKKYISSSPVRSEKEQIKKSLGEVLKDYRIRCQMTQEFVAQSLGVSRQAVSKWEKGVSDPSTSNLLALAKLYHVSVEELMEQIQTKTD